MVRDWDSRGIFSEAGGSLRLESHPSTQLFNLYLDLDFKFLYGFSVGLMSRVFANGPGDRGSIPGRVIQKTKKWYLMQPCLILSIIR